MRLGEKKKRKKLAHCRSWTQSVGREDRTEQEGRAGGKTERQGVKENDLR